MYLTSITVMATIVYNSCFDNKFAVNVANLCYEHFSVRLSKHGKPQKHCEWTLVAAIVKTARITEERIRIEVVAMGTGSKCLGQSKMSPKGHVINDSHAEVTARRSFLRYLYTELSKAYTSAGSDVLEVQADGRCSFKEGIEFHLFSSHVPCGDASIFLKPISTLEYEESVGQVATDSIVVSEKSQSVTLGDKRKLDMSEPDVVEIQDKNQRLEDSSESSSRRPPVRESLSQHRTMPDIFRTGAKCVPCEQVQDSLGPGLDYHVVGVLRTKPGRGERTLSMSCSDKIARWLGVGIQGALLSHFLSGPIRLRSVVIGGSLFDEESIKRATVNRLKGLEGLANVSMVFLHAGVVFEHSRASVETSMPVGKKVVPSSSSIIWYKEDGQCIQEVSACGRRLGITAKDFNTLKARCATCKSEIFRAFLRLVCHIKEQSLPYTLRSESRRSLVTYEDYKQAALTYQQEWALLRTGPMACWMTTPRCYNAFTVDDL